MRHDGACGWQAAGGSGWDARRCRWFEGRGCLLFRGALNPRMTELAPNNAGQADKDMTDRFMMIVEMAVPLLRVPRLRVDSRSP